MEQTPGPKFTRVERLFLSGKWYHRAYGHVLAIGGPIGKGICLIGGIILLICAATALVYGAVHGAEILIARWHLNKTYVFLSCFALFLSLMGLDGLREAVKKNRVEVQRSIEDKIYKAKHDE